MMLLTERIVAAQSLGVTVVASSFFLQLNVMVKFKKVLIGFFAAYLVVRRLFLLSSMSL